MQKIRQIMCCCGNGLGSSMFIKINIQNLIEDLGIKNVTVFNGSITDAHPYSADMFVAGIDVAPVLRKYPRVVILKDLISYEEAREKLKQAFESEEESFFII